MFTETNSSWLIYESIKDLEIKPLIMFGLVFVRKTILLYFFLFFLIIDLYFLIPAVIAQICNPTTELAISKVVANAKIETPPLTAEMKRKEYSK